MAEENEDKARKKLIKLIDDIYGEMEAEIESINAEAEAQLVDIAYDIGEKSSPEIAQFLQILPCRMAHRMCNIFKESFGRHIEINIDATGVSFIIEPYKKDRLH